MPTGHTAKIYLLQRDMLQKQFLYRSFCIGVGFIFGVWNDVRHALILSKLLFEGRKLQEHGMCCILDMQENREEPSKQSQTTISWDQPHHNHPHAHLTFGMQSTFRCFLAKNGVNMFQSHPFLSFGGWGHLN